MDLSVYQCPVCSKAITEATDQGLKCKEGHSFPYIDNTDITIFDCEDEGAKENDIRLDFIQPGNPQQNAYVERYNRTVRYVNGVLKLH